MQKMIKAAPTRRRSSGCVRRPAKTTAASTKQFLSHCRGRRLTRSAFSCPVRTFSPACARSATCSLFPKIEAIHERCAHVAHWTMVPGSSACQQLSEGCEHPNCCPDSATSRRRLPQLNRQSSGLWFQWLWVQVPSVTPFPHVPGPRHAQRTYPGLRSSSVSFPPEVGRSWRPG